MNRSGFTLIELVIALSIVAITLAAAGPSLDRYSKSQNVKNTARDIYNKLQLARITAIRENVNVLAAFNLTAGAEALNIRRGPDKNGNPGSLVLNVNYFSTQGSNNILLSSDVSPPTITYKNNGAATFQNNAANQTITLSHDDSDVNTRYTLVVNMSGGISLTKL